MNPKCSVQLICNRVVFVCSLGTAPSCRGTRAMPRPSYRPVAPDSRKAPIVPFRRFALAALTVSSLARPNSLLHHPCRTRICLKCLLQNAGRIPSPRLRRRIPCSALEAHCELCCTTACIGVLIYMLFVYTNRRRLKRFDETSAASRSRQETATPPRSVVGIGNKGMSRCLQIQPILLTSRTLSGQARLL